MYTVSHHSSAAGRAALLLRYSGDAIHPCRLPPTFSFHRTDMEGMKGEHTVCKYTWCKLGILRAAPRSGISPLANEACPSSPDLFVVNILSVHCPLDTVIETGGYRVNSFSFYGANAPRRETLSSIWETTISLRATDRSGVCDVGATFHY